jgi:hypothetical protein
MGFDFSAGPVEVELLPAELQGLAAAGEFDNFHPQDAGIKFTGFLDVPDGQDQVVELFGEHHIRRPEGCCLRAA